MTFDKAAALSLATQLELRELTVPSALTRGLEVAEALQRAHVVPEVDMLALDDGELLAYLKNRTLLVAAFSETPDSKDKAWDAAFDREMAELFRQVRTAMLPELDSIIDQMRVPFEAAGAKLTEYVRGFGFTSQTSADQVIDMDAKAIAAFREIPELVRSLQPYAAIRRQLADLFDLSPTPAERRRLAEDGWVPDDYSVLYASGDGWSVNGGTNHGSHPRASLDWLRMASGGLALNSVDEVRAKVYNRLGLVAPHEEEHDEGDDVDA